MDGVFGEIERHLVSMEESDTSTDDGANEALAHAMAATSRINQHVDGDHSRLDPLRGISDTVLDKFDGWIKRLVGGLRRIAAQLRATFSISVGTGISITMNFGPFEEPDSSGDSKVNASVPSSVTQN